MIFFTGPLGARVRILLITTVSVFLVFQIYNHVNYKTLPFGEVLTPVNTPEHTGTASTTLMPTAVDASTTATTSPSPEVHKVPLVKRRCADCRNNLHSPSPFRKLDPGRDERPTVRV